MFPVIYGILQIGEIICMIIIYQIYKYIHRNDISEEDVTSVVDNSILTHVPMIPEKRTPKVRISYNDSPLSVFYIICHCRKLISLFQT